MIIDLHESVTESIIGYHVSYAKTVLPAPAVTLLSAKYASRHEKLTYSPAPKSCSTFVLPFSEYWIRKEPFPGALLRSI